MTFVRVCFTMALLAGSAFSCGETPEEKLLREAKAAEAELLAALKDGKSIFGDLIDVDKVTDATDDKSSDAS